jgi:hypothetical protein
MYSNNTTMKNQNTLCKNKTQEKKDYDSETESTSENDDYSFGDDEYDSDNDSCSSCGATRSTMTSDMEEIASISNHSSSSQRTSVHFHSVIIREYSTTSKSDATSKIDVTYNLFEYEYFRNKKNSSVSTKTRQNYLI